MPWAKFVADFLSKRFQPKKDGMPGRSTLVDDYFGQMFQSYAKTCISYALSSSVVKGGNNVSLQDVSLAINNLFPISNESTASDDDSSPLASLFPNKTCTTTRLVHTNLSKDRIKFRFGNCKFIAINKRAKTTLNSRKQRKSRISLSKSDYVIPPSKPIALGDVFDIPTDEFE